jgi:hypothetical protein
VIAMTEKEQTRTSLIAAALTALLILSFVVLILRPPTLSGERGPQPVVVVDPPPAGPAWPPFEYNEVRAYHVHKPLVKSGLEGEGPGSVHAKDGIVLSEAQERALLAALNAKAEPYEYLDMFAPQHAFVFFNFFGDPVGAVEVDLYAFVIVGFYEDPDILAVAKLIEDLGLPLGSDENAEAFRRRFQEHQQKSRDPLTP